MGKYKVVRDERYDFVGVENLYPPLHKYPATMISQVGIEALKELGVSGGVMFDPYCGSGSSFCAGLEVGIKDFIGYDLNPFACLLTRMRFTEFDYPTVINVMNETLKKAEVEDWSATKILKFKNFDYWFSPTTASKLQFIKDSIDNHNGIMMASQEVKDFCYIALSTTMRKCSYTRNGEFKLYRMTEDDVAKHNLDAFDVFEKECKKLIDIYIKRYVSRLKNVNVSVWNDSYDIDALMCDVVLTSPPYGDSATTVSYGQFSFFSNQWLLGKQDSRQLDKKLMGGRKQQMFETAYTPFSLISNEIVEIVEQDEKRGLEVEIFYEDLAKSIENVAKSVKSGGKIIYVVGNRQVKGVRLPTDQFVAEQFCNNGCKHIITYERLISGKNMPSTNSPLNKAGETSATMNYEYIVMLEKE